MTPSRRADSMRSGDGREVGSAPTLHSHVSEPSAGAQEA